MARSQRLYVPTWWEKRFPWVRDLLIRLDPEPIAGWLQPLWVPGRWLIELVCAPLAAMLAVIDRGLQSVAERFARVIGAGCRALPLPEVAQDLLWLRPVTPRHPIEQDAHGVLRRQCTLVHRWAFIAAVVLHAAAFTFWPTMRAADFGGTDVEMEAIALAPSIEIPPPPAQIARPATPIMATAEIEDDITIAPTTFEDNPVAALPPPPEAVPVVGSDQPFFVSWTVAPSIINRDEFRDMLIAEYPPLLREAGIGGQMVALIYVSDEGRVLEVRLGASSGHQGLDEAALRVARQLLFSPALTRDLKVATWVRQRIDFTVR